MNRNTYTLASLMCGALAACGGSPSTAPDANVLAAGVTVAADASEQNLVVAKTGYSVVNLGSGQISEFPIINAHGQVAYSLQNGARARAFFFDGDAVADIGTLGGASAFARGLNDAGQIAGYADNASQNHHAFRWSRAQGMRDLGTLQGTAWSEGFAINQKGEVAGYSHVPGPFFDRPQAFSWTEAGGMRDLGALVDGLSVAQALSDSGQVAGWSDSAAGEVHAFSWQAGKPMADLGTIGGRDSYGQTINNAGDIAGYAMAPDSPDFSYQGFVWNPSYGMVGIGTLGGGASAARALNASGQVGGHADTPDGFQHAIGWSRGGGLVDLGTLGGDASNTIALNNRQQLVGWALVPGDGFVSHAFVAKAGQPMTDLNLHMPQAPAGLVLDSALAINDKGAIVASSNAGLVLLVPGLTGTDTPVLGPISALAPVAMGTRHELAASFRDQNRSDRHRASWYWGDNCAVQPGRVVEHDGEGSARAGHTWCKAGMYTVNLKLADNTGRSSVVSSEVVVYDPAEPVAAGSGSFGSPRGALARDALYTGPARLSFVAQGKEGMQVRFSTGKLAFEGAGAQLVSAGGARARYEGSGTLDGKPGYRFVLGAQKGDAGPGRVHLRITHADPASGAEVVDYDNQGHGNALLTGVEGSPLSSGDIVLKR